MNGWPKLTRQERLAVGMIAGHAEHAVNYPDAARADRIAIITLLDELDDDGRRREVLAMSAQAYVDAEHNGRVATFLAEGLLEDHGQGYAADLDLARRYHRAWMARRGFNLSAMADSAKAPDQR